MGTNNQAGQALLIVVLVMVIALTVGLSVASRSIINLRTSTDEANAQKAFSAAEAGVERALKLNTPITETIPLNNNSNIKTVNIKSISGSEFNLNGGNLIPQDDGVDVWLSTYPGLGPTNPQHFYIAWGFPNQTCASSPPPAAIEVIVIYAAGGSGTSPTSKRYTYDPCEESCGGGGSRNNNFDCPQTNNPPTIDGKNYTFYTRSNGNGSINASNNALIARVIPLYASTSIGIKACSTGGGNCVSLPGQGKIIESTGEAGGAQRKVIYYQGFRKVPSEFFQYALFSH